MKYFAIVLSYVLIGTLFVVLDRNVSFSKPELKVSTQLNRNTTSNFIKIDGKNYKESEVFGADSAKYYDLKQKVYDFQYAHFRKFLANFYLNEKAQEFHTTPDKFIDEHLAKQTSLFVSDKDIKEFGMEKKIPESDLKSNLKLRGEIRNFLEFKKKQDLVESEVAKWSAKKKIEIFFEAPKFDLDIPIKFSPSFGPDNAKVTIIAFSDFECPFCAKAATSIKEIKNKYKDKIKVVYKHLPLQSHKFAGDLAKASVCLDQLDKTAFWIFYDEFFKNQDEYLRKLYANQITVEDILKKIGFYNKDINDCLYSESPEKLIELDFKIAQDLGLDATPVFFINGRVVKGAIPTEDLEKIVKEELNK